MSVALFFFAASLVEQSSRDATGLEVEANVAGPQLPGEVGVVVLVIESVEPELQQILQGPTPGEGGILLDLDSYQYDVEV